MVGFSQTNQIIFSHNPFSMPQGKIENLDFKKPLDIIPRIIPKNKKINILIKKNIIKDKKFFIAASHQSMFETFYLQTIFNSPVFILKKELLLIPVFGWYLKKIGSISIKRNKVTRDNLNFFENISKTIAKSKRPIIIFPQGTRVLPDERPPFKKGVGRIYEELNILCQPLAINSGYVWPKKGIKVPNKTITISILKPIETNLESKNFLEVLELNFFEEHNVDFLLRLNNSFSTTAF